MRKLSCGVIIVNELNEILMGKVTGSKPVMWDLPKGVLEGNETPIDAAVRECREEFNLEVDPKTLKEIGHIPYNRDKNLHLFLTYRAKDSIDLSKLSCSTSYVNFYTKKEVLEVSGYDWISLYEVHEHCCPSMVRALGSLITEIETESKYGEYRLAAIS